MNRSVNAGEERETKKKHTQNIKMCAIAQPMDTLCGTPRLLNHRWIWKKISGYGLCMVFSLFTRKKISSEKNFKKLKCFHFVKICIFSKKKYLWKKFIFFEKYKLKFLKGKKKNSWSWHRQKNILSIQHQNTKNKVPYSTLQRRQNINRTNKAKQK